MAAKGENRRAQRGMTLIETLIALAILAGVVIAAYAMLAQGTRFAATEQERLVAGIVADNALIDELVLATPPDEGENEKSVSEAGRDWIARTTIARVTDEALSISVAVTRVGDAQVLARAETLRALP